MQLSNKEEEDPPWGGTHLARHDERDRLDSRTDGLVRPSDFGVSRVDGARGGEAHTALRLRARIVRARKSSFPTDFVRRTKGKVLRTKMGETAHR